MDKRNRIHRKSGDGGGVEENFDLYRNRTGDVCRDAISAAAGGPAAGGGALPCPDGPGGVSSAGPLPVAGAAAGLLGRALPAVDP